MTYNLPALMGRLMLHMPKCLWCKMLYARRNKGRNLMLKGVLFRALSLQQINTIPHFKSCSNRITDLNFHVSSHYCIFYLTDFHLDNLLVSFPISAALWCYECYGNKACSTVVISHVHDQLHVFLYCVCDHENVISRAHEIYTSPPT